MAPAKAKCIADVTEPYEKRFSANIQAADELREAAMGSPRILRQTGCAGFASAACPHDSAGVREPPSLGEAAVW